MFAKLAYNGGASPENILADVMAILTGTTNKTLLSADCNKPGTAITATTASGWEALWAADNVGTSQRVLPSASHVAAAWNGSVFLVVNNASSTHYTSPDAKTWTSAVTPATASDVIWNGTNFVMLSSSSIASVYISPTGATGTWLTKTLPSSTVWKSLAANSTTTVALSNATTVCASSIDYGVTWVSSPLPTSGAWADIAHNGTVFCAVGGATMAATSPTGLAGSWTAVTLPVSATWTAIKWDATIGLFIALASGSVTYLTSPTGATGTWTSRTAPVAAEAVFVLRPGLFGLLDSSSSTYYTSLDAINWLPRVKASAEGVSVCASEAWDGSKTLIAMGATQGVINYFSAAGLSSNIRAVNSDATTYKRVSVDIITNGVSGVIHTRHMETLGSDTYTNLAFNSDVSGYAQQIDLTNGGILYLSASARHLIPLSYLPATSTWGSAIGGGFSLVVEVARDDLWSTGYPCSVFSNSGIFDTASYSPRLKTGIATDTTGSGAFLVPSALNPITKQVLDASNVPAHAAIDIRLQNYTNFTYGLLGGVILGGLKQTTDNFGSSADETIISGVYHFVMAAGSGFPTARFLVPEE